MTPLQQIEEMVSDCFCFDMEFKLRNKRPFTQEEAQEMSIRLGKVYCKAHGHNKDHKCYDVHEDWRKE